MNDNQRAFLTKFISLHPSFKNATDRIFNSWAPKEPPITMIFSDLGRVLSKEFVSIDLSTREKVFELIEESFIASDTSLKTVVATGLLEALAFSSFSDEILFSSIEKNLKNHSKAYLSELMKN